MKRLFSATLLSFLFVSLAYATTLMWDANTEDDLAGYNVHFKRANTCKWYGVDVGNRTELNVSSIRVPVEIAVSAYDASGNESEKSDEIYYGGK